MDAIKYLKEKKRMCNSYNAMCDGCGFGKLPNCNNIEDNDPEKSVAIVGKWSAEHPIKTRQSEFLKMFPDVKFADGVIDICPCQIDTKIKDNCSRLSPCFNCRKEYWLAEVQDE